MRLALIITLVLLSGCSPVEIGKTIWGSSTRALEEARADAITKTYDKSYWDTLRSSLDVMVKQDWVIFKKDEVAGIIVLMGIRGSVNTTEVGVFFVEVSPTQTRIEISSLSTTAKRMVAKRLFHGIDVNLGLAQFDPAIDSAVIEKKDKEEENKVQ